MKTLFSQYKRLFPNASDDSLVFTNTNEREAYLTDPFRYAGQIVADLQTESIYILNNNKSAWIKHMTLNDIILLIQDKANYSHSHAIQDITDLQNSLNAKAALSHVHTIANITNLQDTLNNIQANLEGQLSLYTNLQTALDAKAALAHTHEIANVTGLELALDLKAATEHDHLIDEIIGLQAALDAKADTVNVNGILESTDNWAYAADNGNIIVQGTASVGTFTIKVKYKLYQSAVTKSVNLFPSSMKCGSYVRFELCEYCRDTTRGDGGYYPQVVGFTINKFFDYNTPYSGSSSTLSNEVGAGYMYENQQDDSNRYFGSTQRTPFNAITLTVDHNNYPSEGNTWIIVLLTGTIL